VGCGQDHLTGLRLQLVAGEGLSVTGRFTLSEHHQGAPGLAHGGMLAAALDEVLGGLAWLLQRPMVTGRLQVEYLRPAPVGSTLDLEADVVGVMGRRIFCRGSAVVADASALGRPGDVLARAQGVFIAVPLEHFRTHGRPLPAPERSWQVNP
jgi:acyl-coenzyme A thioesterase PaaI-like protein